MCKSNKGHKFQKFDDTSLFCERCGERRVIAPHYYQPYPWYPTPYVPHYPWPYVVWSDTGTTTVSTGMDISGSTSFVTGDWPNQSTLTDGSDADA